MSDWAASSGDQGRAGVSDGDRQELTIVSRTALVTEVVEALNTPPVGLILVELQVDYGSSTVPRPEAPVGQATAETGDTTAEISALVRATAIRRIGEQAASDDRRFTTESGLMVLLRAATTAPAEAEGLALRIQKSLVDPMVVGDWQVICRAGIAVATSLAGDSGDGLVRYAEHALEDAKMLGGDALVVFDDHDRELLLP